MNIKKKNFMLFSRDLNYLFQYFNSDKGSYFKNQYIKPIKFSHTLIEGHNYQLYYEKYLKDIKFENNNVLEIGTGSGCIAITLKKNLITPSVTSLDISKKTM